MENGRTFVADGGVTVKREEDVALLTQLAHKPFGLATLHTRTETQTNNIVSLQKEIVNFNAFKPGKW